jgi:hypothetical protein
VKIWDILSEPPHIDLSTWFFFINHHHQLMFVTLRDSSSKQLAVVRSSQLMWWSPQKFVLPSRKGCLSGYLSLTFVVAWWGLVLKETGTLWIPQWDVGSFVRLLFRLLFLSLVLARGCFTFKLNLYWSTCLKLYSSIHAFLVLVSFVPINPTSLF